jgi:hypothetical protein
LAKENLAMKMGRSMLLLLMIGGFAALLPLAKAQTLVDSGNSSATVGAANMTEPLSDLTYTRPTQRMKVRNYFFDAFGPYPIVGAALAAGINQADNTPPEWKQGAAAYGKRFGSDFAIAGVSTTTRMRWQKPSKKTRCTTAVNAGDSFRGLAMPCFRLLQHAAATTAIAFFLLLILSPRMPAP